MTRTLLCLGLAVVGATSHATILTFDIAGATSGSTLSQDYGDNVTATTMGAFGYGDTHGFTPDVVTEYDGFGATEELNFWTTGYSDLTNVAEYEPDGAPGFAINLVASGGNLVELHGFDLGNFGSEITIPSLTITDEANNVLFSQTNFVLPVWSTPHLSFDFGTPLVGQTIRIAFDLTGLGGNSDNVGIDNIAFSQAPVPEPMTLVGLAAGIGALARRRRNK